MHNIEAVLPGLAVMGLGISYHIWAYQCSRRMLDDWAHQNHYWLLEARQAILWPGPFWFISKSGAVYHVTVADDSGLQRKAWVFCGYPLTFMQGSVDVRWKQPERMRL